MLGKVP
jgi:hypothetical protein